MTERRGVSPSSAVNLPELLARLDNDRQTLCELIVIFRKTFPPLLQSLQQAVARSDMNRVKTSGHALKGMLSGLSVTRAAATASRLEQMGRDGIIAGLTDALTILEHEVANLLPELETYAGESKS